ncbi:MAG: ABC transporter ATP-binding protein [Bacilli bacterium]
MSTYMAPSGQSGLFRLVLSYAKRQAPWLIAVLIASFTLMAAQIFQALLTGRIMNLSIQGMRSELLTPIALFCGLFVFGAGMTWLSRYAAIVFSARAVGELQQDLLRKTVAFPAQHTDSLRSGDMQTRINQDTETLASFMTGDFHSLILQPLLAVVAGVVIASFNLRLFLVTFAYTPLGMVMAAWLNRRAGMCYPRRAAHVGASNHLFSQILAGFDIVKIFGLHDWFAQRANRSYALVYSEDQRINRYVSLSQPVCSSISFVPRILSVLYGGWLVTRGDLQPGTLLADLQLLNYAIGPTVYLPFVLNNWGRTKAALQRVKEVLDGPEERRGGMLPTPSEADAVVLDRVVFSYPGAERELVLDHVSLSVKAGTRTAIVGPSGSGKSSLLALLCGLYAPQAGQVRLWGDDVQTLDLAALRAQIATVSQRIELFSGTIAAAIGMGNPNSTRHEIRMAAQMAGADEFIAAFPAGYETHLEDQGSNLSGGQRQRLAIARALLRDAPLVLFDEPASALHAEVGEQLRQTLSVLTTGRTVIWVTHRLADAVGADQIYVLARGRIIESGVHEELLRSRGMYRSLWEEQQGEVSAHA